MEGSDRVVEVALELPRSDRRGQGRGRRRVLTAGLSHSRPSAREELLGAIAEAAGIPGWLGNEPASGTEIIERLGPEHVESGKPIVYTSADSVLQIAAHEEHFGLERLLALCAEARERTLELGIARIIARPFVDAPEGSARRFERTYNRRDFSLTPPAPTVLDALKQRGVPVVGVGKIEDIFAGTGVTLSVHTKGNDDGMRRTTSLARDLALGLVFVNLEIGRAHV